MLHFQHSHIMLSSDFLLIYTNQDLSYLPHPLLLEETTLKTQLRLILANMIRCSRLRL